MYKTHAIDSLDAPSEVFMVLERDLKTNQETKFNGFFRGDSRRLDRPAYQPAFDSLKPAAVVWMADEKSDAIYNLVSFCVPFLCSLPFLRLALQMFLWVQLEPRTSWGPPLQSHPRRYLKKHHVCYRVIRFFEHKHSVVFSHVVITRPDVMLPIPIGPAAAWPTPDNSSHVMTALYNNENSTLPHVSMWEEVLAPEFDQKVLDIHATDIFNVAPRAVAHGLLESFRQPCCLFDEANHQRLMGDRVFKLALGQLGLLRTYRAFKFKILRSKEYCIDMAKQKQHKYDFMFVAYC